MSFTYLLEWVINENPFRFDFLTNYTSSHTITSFCYNTYSYGGCYIDIIFEDDGCFMDDSIPEILIFNPPTFPESLTRFSDYAFESTEFEIHKQFIFQDIEDYAYTYINCRAKVRRKLLAHRIEDLLKRCSLYDQSILRIILFHLPNLDINYHHPIN
jgi:hypothetical protein